MSDNNFTIKDSKNGSGVFATINFSFGQEVMKFNGRLFLRDSLPTPYSDYSDHYMQIDTGLYLGPSGGPDDYVNHSCEPNCGVYKNGDVFILIAIKNIDIGDEITWDYSTTMDEDDWEMVCRCESRQCRGVIRDFKYLPKSVQEKYVNLKIVPTYILNNL